MRAFVQDGVRELLSQLIQAIQHTRQEHDHEAIHDLRVAARRLTQCLRVFAPFFPDRGRRKVLRQVRALRRLAGEVRNRDVVADLLAHRQADVAEALRRERGTFLQELLAELERWERKDRGVKWRAALELPLE